MNSPDDHANLYFSELFAKEGRLWYQEPINEIVGGRAVSRSMVYQNGRVVPVGFPGLALIYGLVAKVTGASMIPYFTPFLFSLVMALLAYCLFELTERSRALLIVALIAFNPVVLYYVSRGLYPNAAEWSFFGLSLILTLLVRKNSQFRLFGASLALALAVLMRPVDAPLMAALGLVIVYFVKDLRRDLLIVGLAGLSLGAIGSTVLNNFVYGDWFRNGYSEALSSVTATEALAFSMKTIFGRILKYGPAIAPVLGALGFFSIISWFKTKNSQTTRMYFSLVLVCLILNILPYAIFGARDELRGISSIGVSLVRYWLPSFILLSLISANFVFEQLVNLKSGRRFLAMLTVVASLALLSVRGAWIEFPDSLAPIINSLKRYEWVRAEVLKNVPNEAILIVDQTDKIFFPARTVISRLRNPGTYNSIADLLRAHRQVFYFGVTLPETDIDFLLTQALPKDVDLASLKNFNGETLYEFTLR